MRAQRKKNMFAYRPVVSEARLESRLVLNTHVPTVAAQVAAHSAAAQNALAARQLRAAFQAQVRAAQVNLQNLTQMEMRQIFTNGGPTQQQLVDFHAFVAGAVDATAFRLSSQAALLPGSANLVARIQRTLLDQTANGVINRLTAVGLTGTSLSNAALQNAITRGVNPAIAQTNAALNGFFNTTNLARLSVDQNGFPIPLSQFMGQQVVTQLANSLGNIAFGFPTVANSVLFPNGATTATTAAQTAFLNQAGQALATAGFQLGNNLVLLPQAFISSFPQVQSAFAGPTSSLFSAIQNLPASSTTFNTAAMTAFHNNFQTLVSPLSTALALSPQFNPVFAATQNPSIFTSASATFGNGFNTGFGTGFPGFGVMPTSINGNLVSGFNIIVNSGNPFGPILH
jgi:hypothetical protein